jgi:hypothetical protein
VFYIRTFISALFTFIFVLPLALPYNQIDLTNSEHILTILFVMILFTSLFTKLLSSIVKIKT